MGMGRQGEGLSHNRTAALVLAIGVATNPMPFNNGPTGGPARATIQTETSAPVAPTRAPTPIRENKQTRNLGERVRSNIRALGFDKDISTEQKAHEGKFSAQNETDSGYPDSSFSHRHNNARTPRGNNHPSRRIRESEHSQTNDLSELVLQELATEAGLFHLDEGRLIAKIQAAISKVLSSNYVSPEVIAKIELQDKVTGIVAEAAINGSNLLVANPRPKHLAAQQSLKAETIAKIEAAKAEAAVARKPAAISSKSTEGKIGFNPVPEATGGKVLPLTAKEEAVLVDRLLSTFVEDTHFTVEKNSEVRLTVKGIHVVAAYLEPMLKDKNLSHAELDIPLFIEANINIFRAKGREIRLQKFVNAQIAEALKGRDKTQSLNRRQERKFFADRFEFEDESTEADQDSTTDTKKYQIDEADVALAETHKESGHTGFNSESEKAKADAYDAHFDNPNSNYPDNFETKDTAKAYARLKKHSPLQDPALTPFFDSIGDDDTTVVEVGAVTINGGSRSDHRRSKHIPQPRGKSPLA